MELTIFAKKRTTKEGKRFYAYLTRLTKKDGTEQTVGVKFQEACGSPKAEDCPMILNVPKAKAHMSIRDYEREDTGEMVKSYTLWVSEWEKGRDYVDTTLDNYML